MNERPVQNPALQKMLDGRPSVGSWCVSGSPLVAEIMAGGDIDWIILDIEHYPVDLETTAECIRAIEHGGAVPMVRLPQADPIWIKRYLDAGALGIICPQIRTADEVRQLVKWSRFPPQGQRPYGRGRAGWRYRNYLRQANDQILVMAQIETPEAVADLDDILSVPGCDGFFVGPTDLAIAYGWPIPAEGAHEQRDQLVKDLGRRIRDAGKIAGTVTGDANDAARHIEQGYLMVNLLGDLFMIDRGIRSESNRLRDLLAKSRRPSCATENQNSPNPVTP